MFDNILILIALLFALTQLRKYSNLFSILLTLGLILAHVLRFIIPSSIGYISIILIQFLVLIYVFWVDKTLKEKVLMLSIVLPSFVLSLSYILHFHYLYPLRIVLFIPLLLVLITLFKQKPAFRAEIGFLAIIAMDAFILFVGLAEFLIGRLVM